jgi:hypothetical protein
VPRLAEGPDRGSRMATRVPPAGATCGTPGTEGFTARLGAEGAGLAGAGAGLAVAAGGAAGGGDEQAATSISKARQADRHRRRTADSLSPLKA